MKTRVIHLDMISAPSGMRMPVNLSLFQMADRFAKAELASPLDMTKAEDVWVVCLVDENENPIEVLAIAGWQSVVDVFLFRVKPSRHSAKATKKLWDRLNDFFSDRGMRGSEALIYISDSEKPEQRCPAWKEWLKLAKAKTAERFKVVIR